MTATWWKTHRPFVDLFISPVVLEEIGRGSQPAQAQKRLEVVKGIPILPVTTEIEEIAQYYVRQKVMPSRDTRDAFHVAIASVNGLDYLLTWNFNHLANTSKRRHLQVLNDRLGLPLPIICPPPELLAQPAK